ncbi:hypothetical protein [Enterocloster clostridioformis]|mgnify:CR=1 FL=1|uniref:Uncharacterized protein n=1 Tax=[Clostridium] clostridioforme 90A8 TaxID=999408 RepID=A0A0E2H1E2_9FIRM|nr:hypothetical protein [Enterocloster clostridioformis]ENZ05825.1 hypothetical protein HMPREF1090_05603 [[Clostridium] clostridioforme 90A8]
MAMNEKELKEYRREYNKDNYKTMKVYVKEEEYPPIIDHMKRKGYKSLSGYVKDLIEKDMQGTPGINVKNNKGIVANNIHGDINMK